MKALRRDGKLAEPLCWAVDGIDLKYEERKTATRCGVAGMSGQSDCPTN